MEKKGHLFTPSLLTTRKRTYRIIPAKMNNPIHQYNLVFEILTNVIRQEKEMENHIGVKKNDISKDEIQNGQQKQDRRRSTSPAMREMNPH